MKVPYFNSEKIKVGIFGFTGCAGDQLVLIHDEDRLLEYFNAADIRSFIMASSLEDKECELDLALVEGSINTEEEIKELIEIRHRSKLLVAIGTCAVHGGIQAGNFEGKTWAEAYNNIYGDVITLSQAHEPKPLSEFVKVDMVVPGCPIDKDQIYNAFSRLVRGLPPEVRNRPVCEDCKLRENICLLDSGKLCLGPVTASGCNAACPSNNIECMGCYGLYEGANLKGFILKVTEMGFTEEQAKRRLSCHGGLTTKQKIDELLQEEVMT